MDSLIIDSESRKRIVSDMDKNFFVEAGAGSGKTTMLVNRMVAMVESGIPVEKICAITFTKAAAGVFLKRFQKILIERSNPNFKYVDKGRAGDLGEPTELTRKRCAEALEKIDLCFMGTIDSFCNLVLSEHPSEAGIPSDTGIIDDDELNNIAKRVYVNISSGLCGNAISQKASNFAKFQSHPEEVFVNGITVLYEHRNALFQHPQYTPANLDTKFAGDKNDLATFLQLCKINRSAIQKTGQASDKGWNNLDKAIKVLNGRWDGNIVNVIYTIKSIDSMVFVKEPFLRLNPNTNLIEIKPKSVTFKPDLILDKLKNEIYAVSMDFLCDCVRYLEEALLDTGKLTFYDYLLYLRNMLRDDASKGGKLINYIYKRHSYFLIDEFQDTNPMQAEVFFYLTAVNPVVAWEKCNPKAGSLFIVGDPKQSIYRFRNADVSSFLKIKTLFEEGVGEVLKLTRNFRSTKDDIIYFNDVFNKLLPEENENQSKFELIPIPDDKEPVILDGIYKYRIYEKDPTHLNDTDEKQVLKLIKRLVGNPGYSIIPEGEDQPRQIMFKDFMIIVTKKKLIPQFIVELEGAGIPVRVEGKVLFEESEALKAVYSLYAAVGDTDDEIALNRALKSVLIRLSDEVLVNYKATGRDITLKYRDYSDKELKPLSGNCQKVEDALNMLRNLSSKANNLSPAILFSTILDSFEIFNYVPANHLEILYYTLELIRNAENSGDIVTHKECAEYLLGLLNGEASEERCLRLTQDENCVHIANLHKVKGLEAPIVFLAYDSAGKGDNADLRIEYDGTGQPKGYFFKLKVPDYNMYYFETNQYNAEEEKEKASLRAERDRLTYVGATRVRNALFIAYNKNKDGEIIGRWEKIIDSGIPDAFQVIADNPQYVEPSYPKEIAKDLYEASKKDDALKGKDSITPSYEIKIPSKIALKHKTDDPVDEADLDLDEDVTVIESSEETLRARKYPDVLGTLIHALMERIVSSKGTVDKKQLSDELIREYVYGKCAVLEDDFRSVMYRVCDRLENGGYEQENDLPADILSELFAADEVYCEVPFSYKENNELWNGTIDLLYKKNDAWHIVDYKTGLEKENLEYKYEGQLESYVKALKLIEGIDADAKIYHIEL